MIDTVNTCIEQELAAVGYPISRSSEGEHLSAQRRRQRRLMAKLVAACDRWTKDVRLDGGLGGHSFGMIGGTEPVADHAR